MPHLARHLAIAACFAVLGSAADAAPKKKRKAPPVEETTDEEPDPEDDTTEDDAEEAKPKKHKARKRQAIDDKSEERDDVDVPVKVRKRGDKRARNWHFAIGPNAWLASVDAKVAVGEKSVGAAIDFFDLQHNTKVGVPVLAEARYKRFSFVGDVLYGVVALKGGNDVGPLMVTLDGTVTNWLVDGIAGYRVLGADDSSKLSAEARAGIRYQRTVIAGSVGLSGNPFSPAPMVDSGADFLAGARVFVRPSRWFYFSGTVDQSLFGSSTSTWSAGADANLRIGSHVLLAGGWRTLTQQKEALSTVMHGPKVALQLVF